MAAVIDVAPGLLAAAHDPGHGLLELDLAVRDGITRLVRRRHRFPLRCTVPLHLDASRPELAWIYVQNPTGVVGAGDRLEQRVTVGPGAMVHLTTPSATKVLRMVEGSATQDTTIELAQGAYLEQLPEPVIPQQRSSYEQRTTVRLAAGSAYVGADVLAPGRVASGEAYAFDRLAVRTAILGPDGEPLAIDAMVVEPRTHAPARRGALAGTSWCATVVVAGPGRVGPDLAAELDAIVAADPTPGLVGGAGALPHDAGVLVRALAPSSASAAALVRALWSAARVHLIGTPPPRSRK
ncbi:hypothetical protein BH10ACT1_BH10ACT1_22400 [soil metagenome]